MTNTTSASLRGRELYHAVWTLVAKTFFDTSRLANWSSWEHRFDEQIDGETSALEFIDRMLVSLGDTYTERVVPPAVQAVDGGAPVQPQPDEPNDVLAVLTPSNIGYLRISSFDCEDIVSRVEAGVQKIAGCDGVILDLRGNSGGRMHQAMECCGFFVENGVLASLKMRHEAGVKTRTYMVCEPQFFCEEELPDGTKSVEMYTRHKPLLAGKPVVIIINRRTASAGELMVAAIVQNGTDGKVSIVGSGTTPGKGIGQAEYSLFEGEIKVRVTRTHWFAPGGDWLGDCGQTARNGIEPWITVENDRGPEGLAAANAELKKILGRDTTAA